MADARGENWYLEAGVEPTKITVPELRSILLKHGVNYPSSAKKPQLVELFTTNVLPQAATLQRAAARTVRSTRGIVDVPSSSGSTTTNDDADDDTLVPPPSAVRQSSRRRTRATTAEEEDDKPAPVPTRTPRRARSPTKTIPKKHDRDVDLDTDVQPAYSRQRKNFTPQAKQPMPDPEAWHRPAADSPFTQDNPFQSGSSPPNPDPRDRRRKTMGFEHRERRKSDASRRRTFQTQASQQDDGIVVPSRKTFDVPIARVKRQEQAVVAVPDSGDEGEEYTPEEQQELSLERAKNGEVDVLPARQRRNPKKTASTIQAFLLTFCATLMAIGGGVWREEKFAIGFCGVGPDTVTEIAGVEIPEIAANFLPQCEPCPLNAICYSNLKVECHKDFIKKYHPLSFGGVLPLPPTCEPDTEKTRKATQVANHAVQALRKRRAEFECGGEDAEGNAVKSPDVTVADLKQQLISKKGKSLSNEEFEDLFAKALGEIPSRQEVKDTTNETTGVRHLASDSLAELPLTCSIRRYIRTSLERNIFQIVGIVLFLVSGAYGRYAITSSRATENRAKRLASDVFDRLANQAALAHYEPGAYQDRGLSMNQLRDDVLRNEFSARQRIKIWKHVQKKVERNSNVRAAVREGASGDITRMWEWIGPVRMLEEGRSSGKRDGGRRDLAWLDEHEMTGRGAEKGGKEMKEMKKWEEGHPQY